MPSDKEKELVEVLQLVYQKFYLKDPLLSRAVVGGIVEKVILDTVGEKDYKMWLNSIKLLLPQIR